MDYDLNQNVGVDGQEQQPSQPDPREGVVALELQEVGRTKPGPLQGGRRIGTEGRFYFFSQLLLFCSKHSGNAHLFFFFLSYLSSKPEQQQPRPSFGRQTQVGDDQRQEAQVPQEVLGRKRMHGA